MRPFHYAFKVKNLDETRAFYGKILGCKEGRSTNTWVDFDFFGNQISAHLSDKFEPLDYCGHVDKVDVPIPHFGAIITMAHFAEIEKKLKDLKYKFIVPPQIRYPGKPGEQATMFILDPSGNPLEFKAFKDESEIYS